MPGFMTSRVPGARSKSFPLIRTPETFRTSLLAS